MNETTEARRNLYGRHSGRPLRPTQLAAMEQITATHGFQGDEMAALEETYADVWLEIGFGAGEHLAWQAAQNPTTLMIGAEYFLNGYARACKHVADGALANVRLYHGDARDLMDRLPDGILSQAFILHPDPWPKARQWRRRIICTQTLDRLHTLMRPGAILRMASDHGDYQPWIMRTLQAHSGFAWTAKSVHDWTLRPADWPQTRYEAKSVREGRPTMYITAKRL